VNFSAEWLLALPEVQGAISKLAVDTDKDVREFVAAVGGNVEKVDTETVVATDAGLAEAEVGAEVEAETEAETGTEVEQGDGGGIAGDAASAEVAESASQ
jgi:hypothetical protein